MLLAAFRLLNRHPGLAVYPIALDFLGFVLGLWLIGFGGDSGLSFQIVLGMGLPSVHHSLDVPLFAGGLNLLENAAVKPAYALPVVGAMMLLSAFAQGGYIAALWQTAEGKRFAFSHYLRYGRDYWLRFALFNAIVYLGKMSCVMIGAILLANIGPAAAFMMFVILRVLYAYAEFTLIVDNARLTSAFRNSFRYMKQCFVPTVLTMTVMFAAAGSIGMLVQWAWTPAAVALGIVVYGYVMSGIQLSLMLLLKQARQDYASFMHL